MSSFAPALVFILVFSGVGLRAAEPTNGTPAELVIADFEGGHDDAAVWRPYARGVGGHAVATIVQDNLGIRDHALHAVYRFNVVDRPAEAGVRRALLRLDATPYDHLSFWTRSDSPAADSFRIEFRRPDPRGAGLAERASFIVNGVTQAWRQVLVPLNRMTGIRDWNYLTDLVLVFQSRRNRSLRGGYYIDELALLKTGEPGPSISDPVPAPKKRAWEESVGGRDAARAYLKPRLQSWPHVLKIDTRELPEEDRGFLWRIARDTWRGLDSLSDREHGLPIDNVRFAADSVAPERAEVGDYTNVTNIGLHLIDIIAARELGLVTREDALAKSQRTLATLEKLETYHGFYYNYYDTTTLERTSNFVSFVDSAWLTTGLMVLRNALPELAERATRLIARGDYSLFYDDVEQQMLHGYYTNLPVSSEYRYGALYTESRLGSLIAIGKGEAPAEHWFRMVRTFDAADDWQMQRPRAEHLKTVGGYRFQAGHYRWDGIDYIPSWGGSMFEALMPTLVVDEAQLAPMSLGRNDYAHAVIQRRYALEHLGYPVWGMSPSATPATGGYSEYGVPVLGARGYGPGVITPHASALALAFTPTAAIANLRRLTQLYDIYGEYGYYDAVDPRSGEVARKYLSLDQSMLFIALANYLGEHCIQKYFAADPIAKNAFKIIADENFLD